VFPTEHTGRYSDLFESKRYNNVLLQAYASHMDDPLLADVLTDSDKAFYFDN
jgi:hypothetical protein